MTIKRSTRLTLWLALAELALPFVWMKIGPQGKAYYGPDVRDIYILGATILGKDLRFVPLALATVFQLAFGVLFILCAFAAVKRSHQGTAVKRLAWVQMALLLLFPWWLSYYIAGVINNSAAADLRVYPHIGLGVYLVLVVLVGNTLYRSVVKPD